MRAACSGAVLLALGAAAGASDPIGDAGERDGLERALFLCQWRSGHGAPDGAPAPAACRSAAVSVEDALLQTKQWWTFWARIDRAAAADGRVRFNADFAAFRAERLRHPQTAALLLPPGIGLRDADWRAALVRELERSAQTSGAATADP